MTRQFYFYRMKSLYSVPHRRTAPCSINVLSRSAQQKLKLTKKSKSKIMSGDFMHTNHISPRQLYTNRSSNIQSQRTERRSTIIDIQSAEKKKRSNIQPQPTEKMSSNNTKKQTAEIKITTKQQTAEKESDKDNQQTTAIKSMDNLSQTGNDNQTSSHTTPVTCQSTHNDKIILSPESFTNSNPRQKEPQYCCTEKRQLEKALAEVEELKILRDSLIDEISKRERTINNLEGELFEIKNSGTKTNTKVSKKNELCNKKSKTKQSGTKEIIQPKIISSERTSQPANPKCHLVGDSHVRALGQILREDHQQNVYSTFKPGAGFEAIHESCSLELESDDNENVIIFCGTNDVQSSDWSKVKQSIISIISKYKHKRLSFILVPIRWDRPYVNTRVEQFNTMLRKLFKENCISYLDPNFYLRPWHYTRDGIHMNRKGKRLICLKIKSQLLEKVQPSKPSPVVIDLIDLDSSNNNISSTPHFPSTSTGTSTQLYSDVSQILPNSNDYCNIDNSMWSPMSITTIVPNRNENVRKPNFYSNHMSTKRT
uniref:Uncharacterized protein n=1 Tax=Cacopsylla melanoneura TaxID=428564 RepID=A0A8D8QN37_9HEMI